MLANGAYEQANWPDWEGANPGWVLVYLSPPDQGRTVFFPRFRSSDMSRITGR